MVLGSHGEQVLHLLHTGYATGQQYRASDCKDHDLH